jgi:hypothetical protein
MTLQITTDGAPHARPAGLVSGHMAQSTPIIQQALGVTNRNLFVVGPDGRGATIQGRIKE